MADAAFCARLPLHETEISLLATALPCSITIIARFEFEFVSPLITATAELAMETLDPAAECEAARLPEQTKLMAVLANTDLPTASVSVS